jgi:hypothetical protein
MVKTAEQAAEAYRRGIEAFGGPSTYIECGKRKTQGFLAVARCLEEAKAVKLTLETMVSKYRAAAGG